MSDRIPDKALVVRGGRNLPTDLERASATHPSGVTGVSVQCDVGVPVRCWRRPCRTDASGSLRSVRFAQRVET